jgi:Tol biopolymer transport system component
MQTGCQEFASITPDGKQVVYDGTAGRDVHVYVVDVDSGETRALTDGAGWQWAAAVSPDGREVAYLRTENDATSAYTIPIDGKATSKLLVEGTLRPRYSPDGRAIWAGQGRAPSRIDRETRKSVRALTPPVGYRGVAVIELPDGRALIHLAQLEGHDSGGIVLYESNAGEGAAPTWLTRDGVDEALLLMPDARSVLAPQVGRALRGQLTRFPIDGAPAEPLTLPEVLPTKGFALSRGRPGGERIVWSTCTERSDLTVARPAIDRGDGGASNAEVSSLLGQTEWTDESPTWVPGTTKLVVASDRSRGRGLWVLDLGNREPPRQITTNGERAIEPSVSRDAAWVVYVVPASGLFVAAMDGRTPPRRLTTGATDSAPSFSADGATVYFQTETADHHARIASVRVDVVERGDAGAASAIQIVREHAMRPTPGTRDGEIAFLSTEGTSGEGAPMLLDLASGQARPLSRGLGASRFVQLRISADGARAALLSPTYNDVQEIELTSGAVRQHYVSGADEVKDIAYIHGDLVLARQVWSGGIWVAEDSGG